MGFLGCGLFLDMFLGSAHGRDSLTEPRISGVYIMFINYRRDSVSKQLDFLEKYNIINDKIGVERGKGEGIGEIMGAVYAGFV